MKKSTRIITSVIMFLMIFIQAGCGSKSTTSKPSDMDFAEQMQEASTTPYGKYPELVTYTLGKLTGSNNANMPEGDTYEDNAYTRFLRDFRISRIRMFLRRLTNSMIQACQWLFSPEICRIL